jgi:hypothetical protein
MNVEKPEASSPAEQPVASIPSRRAPMALVTWAFIVLVLLIVVVLLILKVTRGSATAPVPPVTPAPADEVHATTSLPASAFDSAGAPHPQGPAPSVLSGQPPLVVEGRPDVVYVGGEFCPYCAAERWALVVALGRLGTFSNLGATSSSRYEAFGGTATFSFDGATYHSRYVTFSPTEIYEQAPSTNAPAGFPALETLPSFEQALLKRYDSTPFSSEPGTLPFVDVANRLLVVGAGVGFSPGLLQGSSMGKIAGELADPTNVVSQAVLGEANEITAAICSVTGQRPRNVCDSPGVRAGATLLTLG